VEAVDRQRYKEPWRGPAGMEGEVQVRLPTAAPV